MNSFDIYFDCSQTADCELITMTQKRGVAQKTFLFIVSNENETNLDFRIRSLLIRFFFLWDWEHAGYVHNNGWGGWATIHSHIKDEGNYEAGEGRKAARSLVFRINYNGIAGENRSLDWTR